MSKTIRYPVVFSARSKILDELMSCEYGSYEDHIKNDGKREPPYDSGRLHAVEIMLRSKSKTKVYLQSQTEVVEFFQAACTGTFGLYHLSTVIRLWYELESLIEDRSVVDRIPISSLGY